MSILGCSQGARVALAQPVRAYATVFPQQHIKLLKNNLRVRFVDVGAGPVVLLVHGHQSRLEEFEEMFHDLSQHFRVIAFDLPGSGYSDKPDVNYSLDLYAFYIKTFIENYIKEPVILAGGSMGGNLALKISREHPALVSKTIAWSPAGVWPGKNWLSWLARRFICSFLYRTILYSQSHFWFAKEEDRKRSYKSFITYIDEVDNPAFRKAAANLAADQLHSENSHINKGYMNLQPTLIVVGDLDDGLDLAKHAIKFADELPDGKLIVMKNVGHSIAGEKVGLLMQYMIEFINDGESNDR
jgi:pimeloyl-ACP methyl ester carboxylesterase